jgi:soluble lytic murein transglycosylase-like protein
MTVDIIIAMIMAIAVEYGIPSQFALAIAVVENSVFNPLAVHTNTDGTEDRGIMQLNSSWYTGDWQDPETNIRAGCQLMLDLKNKGLNWWQVAVAYNCGYRRLQEGPPSCSIDYANQVFLRWNSMRGYRF